VGTLLIAIVEQLLGRKRPPKSISITAFEIEPSFIPYLHEILTKLTALLLDAGISAEYIVREEDFIAASVENLSEDMFTRRSADNYSHAILNPPFRKLNTDSMEKKLLERVGVDCTNLYAAFVWLTAMQLSADGQFSAVTPRSFCNGPYFRPFREGMLKLVSLDRFLLIEERDLAFAADAVLQETVLYHGTKNHKDQASVTVETAFGAGLLDVISRRVPTEQVIHENDEDLVFHLVSDEHQNSVKSEMERLPCSLEQLDLRISTGRVVDFRAREHLRKMPGAETVPLIYPQHVRGRAVAWPLPDSKKANALYRGEETSSLLVPMGNYVLLKRFTSKEESRRLVATLFTNQDAFRGAEQVGFENHLNYYHAHGDSVEPALARGLSVFLNSAAVDEYFRQFSGHTQVNAADLRNLRYPTHDQLAELGRRTRDLDDQDEIDVNVAEVLGFMPAARNALRASRKTNEALQILKDIGVPKEQQNERSALVLLALAGIEPNTAWADASAPMKGITEMMDFFRVSYGKDYAPNTRETVRRFTVHQFVQIGLVIPNPDKPDRAVNSPDNVYQLEHAALQLLKLYGHKNWKEHVAIYKVSAAKLAALRTKERGMVMVPANLPSGGVIRLSAGGQTAVVKALLEEFCPRFTPGGHVLYLGDAGDKWLIQESTALAKLGVVVNEHGKMPDLVVHHVAKNWLVLIEAVTSHGPMNLKRKNELRELFKLSKVGLVFVTAFATRADMTRFLGEISWETEVWVAEAPSHMIHFNGERFLGPYEGAK